VKRNCILAGMAALMATGPAGAATNGVRRDRVDTIIVHAISGPSCSGGEVVFSGAPGDAERWKTFFDRHPFLGIHYVVDREGMVLASTPENRIANHALDNNDTSIGIELVHEGDGQEPYGARQIDALIALLRSIRTRHAVPLRRRDLQDEGGPGRQLPMGADTLRSRRPSAPSVRAEACPQARGGTARDASSRHRTVTAPPELERRRGVPASAWRAPSSL
jgi:hypothetical protein